MRYCRNCGRVLEDIETVCPFCGTLTDEVKPGDRLWNTPDKPDKPDKREEASHKGPPDEKKIGSGTNWCGLIGFIISILSIGLSMFFCISSIAALALCSIGKRQTFKYPRFGKLAMVGQFISSVTFIFWAIILIVVACTGTS